MKIALVFGGRSAEHEVSVTSARCIWQALNESEDSTSSNEIVGIGIDRHGVWWHLKDIERHFDQGKVEGLEGDTTISIEPMTGLISGEDVIDIDVVFPVLHGTFGEDGTIQGLFEMASLPYVGAGVLGSSVAMDKGLARAAFAAFHLNQPKYKVFTAKDWEDDANDINKAINGSLDFPLFVKPCNLGSSIGISKVDKPEGLTDAIEYALRFDHRIIVEEGITDCHEVECAVMGNERVEASIVGEIIPGDRFYSYEDKYVDGKSKVLIPAPLAHNVSESVRELAIKAYRACDIAGLARIDFFVRGNRVFINEINTLPGFTPISMFPQLWIHCGKTYAGIIEELCTLAKERFEKRNALVTVRL